VITTCLVHPVLTDSCFSALDQPVSGEYTQHAIQFDLIKFHKEISPWLTTSSAVLWLTWIPMFMN